MSRHHILTAQVSYVMNHCDLIYILLVFAAPSTFDKIVDGTKGALVEFYAPGW